MIGVSPAYFISRFTDRFSPDDIITSLPDIKAMGYDGFEPEVFHADMLPAWRKGGAQNVRDAAEANGLIPTQFVAHFLLKGFDSPTSLASPFGLVEMREVIDMLDIFEDISVVVVPFAAFKGTDHSTDTYQIRLVEKLGALLKYVEDSGRRMALEIMPDSLIDGYAGFHTLCDKLESDTLGINLDTGHANASGEDMANIVATLGNRILGTHLCDNFGVENHSLAPGRADINFTKILADAHASGYTGSWDVEIICNPAEMQREYTAGLKHITEILSGS
ncbi:sugar phosphate isomerase/epimerase [Pseudodesulfovibrio sp.]|nr:sugar phosphate isomerase/epimerase [Pseudodesulfovibrio sp.]